MTTPKSSHQIHLSSKSRLLGDSLCAAFATTVVMWCIWFLTHAPGVNMPSAITLALLGLAFVLGMARAGRHASSGSGWRVSAVAGLCSGLLNTLILGSFLVKPQGENPEPGVSGLDANALIYIPGFVVASGLIGLASGFLGERARSGKTTDPQGAPHARFAWITAASIFPLLLIGGSVTSLRAGMAVPDWPGTFGANMFLYPIALMAQPQRPEIFYEHSHRLFGALIGLTALTQTLLVFLFDKNRSRRLWSVGIFAAVCVQGYLGGARVLEGSPYLAALHGVLAQAIFAAAVMFAAKLSPIMDDIATGEPDAKDRKRRALTTGLLHSLFLQLILGSLYRHLKHEGNPGAGHTLAAHAVFSLVVVVMAILAGSALMSRQGPPRVAARVRQLGLALYLVVGVQFLLGWGALSVVMSAPKRGPVPTADQLTTAPDVPLFEALVATAHQGNGALLVGVAAWAASVGTALRRRSRQS